MAAKQGKARKLFAHLSQDSVLAELKRLAPSGSTIYKVPLPQSPISATPHLWFFVHTDGVLHDINIYMAYVLNVSIGTESFAIVDNIHHGSGYALMLATLLYADAKAFKMASVEK